MAIMSQSEAFKRVCGYTLGRDYRSKSSLLKWLKIGDAQLQIENLNNKQIRVQKLSFEISPDGKVSVLAAGYDVINTIDELKDMVKRYRLAYQKMKAMEKELRFQGDFQLQLTFIQNRDFICHWPGCRLKTKDRNQIEFHHIVPRELHPRLNQGVTLSYCPSHHRMIFHPESTKGPHSINSPNKLQILNIYPVAPSGYAVEYKRFNDETFFEFFEGDYRNGEVE